MYVHKVLLINQYYAPDIAATGQYAAEICESLAQQGAEVHIVTAQPCYTSLSLSAPSFELINAVIVHRIPMGRFKGREHFSTRVLGYLRFMWRAWKKARALIKAEKPDTIVTFHNPPFIGLIGAYLAHRYKLRYVYIPHDIHPDILIATRWIYLPHPVIWLWNTINHWIFKRATAVIVIGEGMKRTLTEGKDVPPAKVHVIPIWGRPELKPASTSQPIRKELGIEDDELIFLYAGNMGIMHPLEPILEAAAAIQGLPVRFLFVGDGAKRERLRKWVAREKLASVSFLPFQPEDRFVQLVAAANACFVVLEPGLERLAVPSRAFTFLSAGRPLITIMAPEADVARLVTEAECGWNVATAEELARLIRYLLSEHDELIRRGMKARAIYEERFQRDHVLTRYASVILA